MSRGLSSAGGGTRTPDTRIMIAGIRRRMPHVAWTFVGLGGVSQGQICRVEDEIGDELRRWGAESNRWTGSTEWQSGTCVAERGGDAQDETPAHGPPARLRRTRVGSRNQHLSAGGDSGGLVVGFED